MNAIPSDFEWGSYKNFSYQGWGGGSVGRVPAAQGWGPEFRSPEPTQKLDLVQVSAIPAPPQGEENFWKLMNQVACHTQQENKETISKKEEGEDPHPKLPPDRHMCVCFKKPSKS